MKTKLMKLLSVLTVAVLLAVCAVGCRNGDSKEGLSGRVSTDGSTSMEKVIGYLKEAFEEQNKNVTVSYNPTGSSAGITAVANGTSDIGLSSRELKDSEKSMLDSTVLAIDGIALVVNPENPVNDLTVEQIAKLYTGEIVNWKELSGNDAPVVLIGREAGSGTRDGFESITDTEDKCKYTQELTSTGDVIQAVASNPNAVGYASLATVKESVKAVRVSGIEPTVETIQSGAYSLQRNFLLVTKKDSKLSETAQAFFDYITSPAADELITRAGAVPVKR